MDGMLLLTGILTTLVIQLFNIHVMNKTRTFAIHYIAGLARFSYIVCFFQLYLIYI